jgi:hypothetical protein
LLYAPKVQLFCLVYKVLSLSAPDACGKITYHPT